MFTLRDMKINAKPTDLVPSDADQTKLITIAEHFNMSEDEIANANLELVRQERNKLLLETDWVSGTDVPQSLKDVWNPYRQALRDITNTYSSLEDVVWPVKPE